MPAGGRNDLPKMWWTLSDLKYHHHFPGVCLQLFFERFFSRFSGYFSSAQSLRPSKSPLKVKKVFFKGQSWPENQRMSCAKIKPVLYSHKNPPSVQKFCEIFSLSVTIYYSKWYLGLKVLYIIHNVPLLIYHEQTFFVLIFSSLDPHCNANLHPQQQLFKRENAFWLSNMEYYRK